MNKNKRVDGLNGTQYNTRDPSKPNMPKIYVNHQTTDHGPGSMCSTPPCLEQGSEDPCHTFECITEQIYGKSNDHGPVKMDGFILNALKKKKNPHLVMSAYTAPKLPVLSTLAQEFAVFDHWHASCPCGTHPNREYLMSGTSRGMVTNDFPAAGFPQQTHFAYLDAHGVSWKLYHHDSVWMGPAFTDMRTPERMAKMVEMDHFYADLQAGTLPQYSLISPRVATKKNTALANWQHPDNSVLAGEALLQEIYNALRASKYWDNSLFIITYDEHGGFYDHQPPPDQGVPSPDGVKNPKTGFNFDRLGVRIPTVMVSPRIKAGSVYGRPTGVQARTSTAQFDATSIIATVNKIFGVPGSLTARDAWAGTFDDIVLGNPVRTDCPSSLPAPPPPPPMQVAMEMQAPLTDHHWDTLNLLCHLTQHSHQVTVRSCVCVYVCLLVLHPRILRFAHDLPLYSFYMILFSPWIRCVPSPRNPWPNVHGWRSCKWQR